MINIIKTTEGIPEVIDLHVIMEKNHTPEEVDLMTGVNIIMGKTEEVLLKTEVISRDMNRDRGLGINTSPMDLRTTMVVLLHSEAMAGEEIHLFKERAEETSTATATGLTITEEGNLAALQTDHLMTTEVTDRILNLSGGGPETLRDKIPDHHQQGETSLNSVEDQHQEKVEMGTITATDVGVKITFLQSVNNSRIGGENPVIAVSFTKGETAT